MHRSIVVSLFLAAALAASGYHQIKKITIGGEGFWDYLIADGSSGRLYVSHGAEVDVVDTKTGEAAGKITDLKGVHGIALATEFGRGFISNGQAGTVTIFDLKTLKKIGDDVPAGKNPDAIITIRPRSGCSRSTAAVPAPRPSTPRRERWRVPCRWKASPSLRHLTARVMSTSTSKTRA